LNQVTHSSVASSTVSRVFLLADQTVVAVCSLGRKAPAIQHSKLKAYVADFAALPALPPADEVYLAQGTTIKVARSQAAFRAFALGKALGFLIPANYMPIQAAAVARAPLSAVPSGKGKKVLLSGAMQ
jgi:hypothetical protein